MFHTKTGVRYNNIIKLQEKHPEIKSISDCMNQICSSLFDLCFHKCLILNTQVHFSHEIITDFFWK